MFGWGDFSFLLFSSFPSAESLSVAPRAVGRGGAAAPRDGSFGKRTMLGAGQHARRGAEQQCCREGVCACPGPRAAPASPALRKGLSPRPTALGDCPDGDLPLPLLQARAGEERPLPKGADGCLGPDLWSPKGKWAIKRNEVCRHFLTGAVIFFFF